MGHLVETLNKVAAEKHMKAWLAENGYSNTSKEILQANEYAYIATGKIENVLIRIRAFSYPNKLFKLSEYEIDVLIRRAKKLNLVAYAAYFILTDDGELSEEITWERLN